MIENRGDLDIEAFDDANVPVDIWLTELEKDAEEYAEGFRFKLVIGNYMPRKSHVEEAACVIFSDNRAELQKLVKDRVLPLYKVAIAKINGIIKGTNDNLYYWAEEEQ